ncbi:10694_t:CDS:2 [Entrophospora sp. SA101]|nr:10694_t:CDS:2 [Entrophospora sp. SA101]
MKYVLKEEFKTKYSLGSDVVGDLEIVNSGTTLKDLEQAFPEKEKTRFGLKKNGRDSDMKEETWKTLEQIYEEWCTEQTQYQELTSDEKEELKKEKSIVQEDLDLINSIPPHKLSKNDNTDNTNTSYVLDATPSGGFTYYSVRDPIQSKFPQENYRDLVSEFEKLFLSIDGYYSNLSKYVIDSRNSNEYYDLPDFFSEEDEEKTKIHQMYLREVSLKEELERKTTEYLGKLGAEKEGIDSLLRDLNLTNNHQQQQNNDDNNNPPPSNNKKEEFNANLVYSSEQELVPLIQFLDLENKKLTGILDLTIFPNLEQVNCSHNFLRGIKTPAGIKNIQAANNSISSPQQIIQGLQKNSVNERFEINRLKKSLAVVQANHDKIKAELDQARTN